MTLIYFAKGCHPCLSILGDVLFVPVILSLASPSRFLLQWQFCPVPGMRRRCCCCCGTLPVLPVGIERRSLWASPFVEEGQNEKLLYMTINTTKWMGLFRYFMDELYW